jgi:very-short-patch-repair endonuclease
MPVSDRVLVALMPSQLDFAIARDHHWYRIPVAKAQKWIRERWPPHWLAFYLPKKFGLEAYSVRYYARVLGIREVARWELLPAGPRDQKAMGRYYQVMLGPLQQLEEPIVSRRLRRITFITTTWDRFISATEINDLYHDSPLEDALWTQLKLAQVEAERQEHLTIAGQHYLLDFAIYCMSGRIGVETDGDRWHTDPRRVRLDNVRYNNLTLAGWDVLRFNTNQINEEMASYCLPTIVSLVDRYGGLDVGDLRGRSMRSAPDQLRQLGLFDGLD